ncbi:MAG: penicillin acylase family protein [Fimbriimonadia bacterium]|jgi:penicillin amidase
MLSAILSAFVLASVPQQTLELDGETVRITRDPFGVPHIVAPSIRSLFYGAGYAVAQDRLWQMERNRRMAKGEMAEIYGPDALAQDRAARTDGYTEDERQRHFDRLGLRLKSAIRAYAKGVNSWVAEAKREGKLPKEFAQFGVDPRPWEVTDTVAIAQLMSRRFGAFGEGEFRNLLAFTYLEARLKDKALDAVNDIAWMDDAEAPVTVPRDAPLSRSHKPVPNPPRELTKAHLALLPKLGLADLLEGIRAFAHSDEKEFAEAHGLYTRFGSYAIAVDAQRSATGNALLLGAPQMGWTTPQIAHEIRLEGGGIEVAGMGFPGIPGVLIGHTRHLAWTTTSGLGDTEDVFVEHIDPENPANYLYDGKSLPFEVRVEEIKVKGGETVRHEVRRSVHGPVVRTSGKQWAYARHSTYWERELDNFEAFFAFYEAKNLAEFEAACRKVITSHNFLAATSSGEIGYWYAGRYPVRSEKLDPRFPTPGTGEYEWKGFVPFEELPKCVKPSRGWLANWNNKPATWYGHSDTPTWGAVFRSKRLDDLLGSMLLISPDRLREVVRDIATYQVDADFFLEPLLRELPSHDAGARLLRAWDRHEREGSAAAALFRAYVGRLREETLLPTLGNFGSDQSFRQVAQASYLWHVLKPGAKPKLDYLVGRSREQVMRAAWEKAVADIQKDAGDDLSRATFRASQMNLAPLPPVPYSNRGTYIMLAELGRRGVRSISVLCPGQSEDPASPHYSDQRDLASWWMYKPLWDSVRPRTERSQ